MKQQEWSISKRLQRHVDNGVPEARFVASVLQARQSGAPQYGERFKAWLRASGMDESQINETIRQIS